MKIARALLGQVPLLLLLGAGVLLWTSGKLHVGAADAPVAPAVESDGASCAEDDHTGDDHAAHADTHADPIAVPLAHAGHDHAAHTGGPRGAEDQEEHDDGHLHMTGEVALDPTRVVDVPTTAPGRVVRVEAALGQNVEQGDVLAVLHSDAFASSKAAYLETRVRAAVARKERDRRKSINAALARLVERMASSGSEPVAGTSTGAVGPWKGRLLSSSARLQLARTSHDREAGLRAKRISSDAEYEEALQELEAAQAENAALLEEVRLDLDLELVRMDGASEQADAALEAAAQRLRTFGLRADEVRALNGSGADDEDFARLEIRAPRSGTVVAHDVTVGRYVSGEGASLFTIADLSVLWVWCDLYARDLADLAGHLDEEKKLAATVRVAAYGEDGFAGMIDHIGNRVDPHTRTLKVRVLVGNDEGLLKPGMFARVEPAAFHDDEGHDDKNHAGHDEEGSR